MSEPSERALKVARAFFTSHPPPDTQWFVETILIPQLAYRFDGFLIRFRDYENWLEQEMEQWKRVMSGEAALHNIHAWERASARATATTTSTTNYPTIWSCYRRNLRRQD